MVQALAHRPFGCAACKAARPRASSRQTKSIHRRSLQVNAVLESGAVIAITQQAAAFAVCTGAEAVFTRTQLKDGAPGRPEVVPVAAGLGGTLAGTAMVKAGFLSGVGLGVGLVSSLALLAYNAKRTLDTKHDPLEWPGPKAWPASMSLLSFFVLNLFLQGLRESF